MRILSTVPFILLLLYSATPVSGQLRLEFSTLRTSGPVPSITKEHVPTESQIFGFSMDPVGQRLHWVYEDDWYRLHLPTLTWTRHPIQNNFDLHAPRWSVVPGKMELLAWDTAVGRVVRIDSNGVPKRIDQSFNQKTQFAHLSHIEQDGTIHAIGGFGLHHPKNYGIAFSEMSGGWHRTSGDDSASKDPYLSFGHTLFDPARQELILLTKTGDDVYPVTPSILMMNMKIGSIQILHRDVPVIHERTFRSRVEGLHTSVKSGAHRIGFFLSEYVADQPLICRLTAIDLDTHHTITIDGLNPSNSDPGTHHTVLHYNETDSSLYSVQWSHHTIDMDNIVSVTKAKVDVSALKALLAKGKMPDKPASYATPRPVWPWQAAFFATLIGLFIVWRRTRIIVAPMGIAPIRMLVHTDHLMVNGQTWEDLFDGNYPLEGQLLTLLAKAAQNGNPVVSSDTVDRVLIPNHPSPDFIRKIRNQTRKRLEESLQNIQPTFNSQPYILIDRDVLDKRKNNLQLNLAVVELTPPR
jgi:hypothetical protein